MSNPVEMDDTELFDQAVNDGEPEVNLDPGEVVQAANEELETLTPNPDLVKPEGGKPEVDDNAPQVPSWRLREINEEKRRVADENEKLRAELAEFRRSQQQRQPAQTEQQKAARPDPLLDPDGYAKQVREDIRQELLNERREESLQKASEDHPDDFKAAYALAQQRIDPALQARMQASRDPGKTLLTWYREQKTVQEVGTDPNAWLEKKLEERLKDPAFLAKALDQARGQAQQSPQPRNGRPRVELPPTLNGASRANASLRSDSIENQSDRDLWNEVAG